MRLHVSIVAVSEVTTASIAYYIISPHVDALHPRGFVCCIPYIVSPYIVYSMW